VKDVRAIFIGYLVVVLVGSAYCIWLGLAGR
jgi:hypothetical protein